MDMMTSVPIPCVPVTTTRPIVGEIPRSSAGLSGSPPLNEYRLQVQIIVSAVAAAASAPPAAGFMAKM